MNSLFRYYSVGRRWSGVHLTVHVHPTVHVHLAVQLLLFFCGLVGWGQGSFPVNGIKSDDKSLYAITNARLYLSPTVVVDNGVLLYSEGKIVAVGKGMKVPANAVVTDVRGMFVYPSFVELVSDYGIKSPAAASVPGPPYVSARAGAYAWNDALKCDFSAATYFDVDAEKAAEYRKNGFGTVLSIRRDGVMRGTGALVTTGNGSSNRELLAADVATGLSFSKGTSKQSYPSSLVGTMALIRQTFLDADWYGKYGKDIERNISLEMLNRFRNLPVLFEAREKYDLLRVQQLAAEWKMNVIARGNGDEYQRLAEIKKANLRVVVPVNFPEALDVNDPFDAIRVSLAELKHWENAPFNAQFLHDAGITFAITSDVFGKEKDRNKFLERLRLLAKNGLPKEVILGSLTTVPAEWLKQPLLGTLKVGAPANFFLATGDVLEDSAVITQHIIQGKKYEVRDVPDVDVRGEYTVVEGEAAGLTITVKGNYHEPKAEFRFYNKKTKGTFSVSGTKLLIKVEGVEATDSTAAKLALRLEGNVNMANGTWWGTGVRVDGKSFSWVAGRQASGNPSTSSGKPEDGEKAETKDKQEPGSIWYPQTSFGFVEQPEKKAYLLKNATVWTSANPAVLANSDLLLVDGKIAGIGQRLKAPAGAVVIDCSGKHITAGIIDEHSHIGILYGVNEGGTSNSSEVRMSDAINADDINFYRQLSGGVTTIQQLHGSANAIGGQSSIIKLRWGRSPEEMRFENAPGFIKFALGENVKQANWGEGWRYPQTRLGVEQFFYDQFLKAKEYEKNRKEKGDLVRKDLRMETLLEIIHGKRFITCHSYVQSEINMLMKVADSVGFTVNTFTHILEGYKVADKMLAHGANASTFSDWWAYKMEVGEAIPYNAAIMTKMGINVAINSDDPEMARRLNQEAAKCIKYGGLTKEQAWNLVTINPAKMLHIDKRVGSLEVGKDADVVVWSDEPLSIYARPEQTFVDGVLYFDIKRDAELRAAAQAERNRIIAKMLKDPNVKGGKADKPVEKKEGHYHCDDLEE